MFRGETFQPEEIQSANTICQEWVFPALESARRPVCPAQWEHVEAGSLSLQPDPAVTCRSLERLLSLQSEVGNHGRSLSRRKAQCVSSSKGITLRSLGEEPREGQWYCIIRKMSLKVAIII